MKKALVVIDYQVDFVIGSLGSAEALALEPLIFDKVADAIDNGIDVYFTRDVHDAAQYPSTSEARTVPTLHCVEGTEGCEIFGRLKRLSQGSRVFDKSTFGSIELARHLAASGYTDVELCGVATNICVIVNAILIKSSMPECNVMVSPDLVASYDPELGEKALDVMKSAGINVLGR